MRALLSLAAVICFLLVLCLPSYAGSDIAATASLLTDPDEGGWSLQSMVAAGQSHQISNNNTEHNTSGVDSTHGATDKHSLQERQNNEVKALRKQVSALKARLQKEQDELSRIKKNTSPDSSNGNPEFEKTRNALNESSLRIEAMSRQVEIQKTALVERDRKLSEILALQDTLRHNLLNKTAELDKAISELASLRAELAKKDAQLGSQKPDDEGDKDRIEALTFALKDRDNALAKALKRADENSTAQESLRVSLAQKTKAANDLRTALQARSAELKQAAATLADLRAKEKRTLPGTSEQKQGYVAGLMMADGLNRRLDDWLQAGVKIDRATFRSGLEDGLDHQVRLKASEAKRVQAGFMRAVKKGVAQRVMDAQMQLTALAKGRHALKSENGINWYLVRKGKSIAQGRPVRLSMLEKVANGKTISKIPALLLHPGDNLPVVVREGMYLPGEGGEVVAYALAQDVYGSLPLPAGVQPYAVMEYHLKGEPLTTGQR